MLASITARQFQEWRAYADIEPFDERRADYRAAQVVQAVRNTFRTKGKPGVKLDECLLEIQSREPAPTLATPDEAKRARAEVRRAMALMMEIHNKKVKKPTAKAAAKKDVTRPRPEKRKGR
jgi:hypothetical protein